MRPFPLLAALLLLTLPLAGCLGSGEDPSGAGSEEHPTALPSTPATSPPSPQGGFTNTTVFPGTYDTSGPFSKPLTPGPYEVGPTEVLALESALDGEPIQVAVVRPVVPEGTRVPVVVWAGPYFPDLADVPVREAEGTTEGAFYLDTFVPHGYALAVVPLRGSGGSGGCFDFFGPKERADVDQAVRFLGEAPWSTGDVGMVGLSYEGVAALHVAAAGNPHLSTMAILAPEPELYDHFVRNGTPSVVMGPGATTGSIAVFSLSPYGFNGGGLSRDPERIVASANCPDAVEALSSSLLVSLTGEPDPLGYWATRNQRPLVESNYRGSLFLLHGFNDQTAFPHLNSPWDRRLAELGIEVKVWWGQFGHVHPDKRPGDPSWNPTPRWDYAEMLLRWFDHELKGAGDVDVGSRVQVADTLGRWRAEETWPPADATPLTLYLEPNGGLSALEPDATGDHVLVPDAARAITPLPVKGGHDPVPSGEGWAAFLSDPLDAETLLAGTPRLHITVTPAGPGGSLTAFLFVEHEDGTRQRVSYGQMDLRFAAGDGTARPVVPSEPLLARMELEPNDIAVPVGARLGVVVGQGGYGQAFTPDCPTCFGPATYYRSSLPTAPVLLHAGPESTLTVAWFERAADRFFEPPE